MRTFKILLVVLIFISISSSKPIEESSEVQWITFTEAVKLNEEKPKKFLVDLYTDWCGWCKVMDRETYNNPVIAKYINDNFYPVKFDAEQKEDLIYKDQTFKFIQSGRRGVHEFAAAITNNQLSYPTTVFLDEELRVIQPIPGFLKPKQMEPILVYMNDNHYKTTDWKEFNRKHKSSL